MVPCMGKIIRGQICCHRPAHEEYVRRYINESIIADHSLKIRQATQSKNKGRLKFYRAMFKTTMFTFLLASETRDISREAKVALNETSVMTKTVFDSAVKEKEMYQETVKIITKETKEIAEKLDWSEGENEEQEVYDDDEDEDGDGDDGDGPSAVSPQATSSFPHAPAVAPQGTSSFPHVNVRSYVADYEMKCN